MSSLFLDEKVVRIDRALQEAGVPHAFGGALALAYYAEPRSTIDVDVNVFVSPSRAGTTLDALKSLGVGVDAKNDLAAARRDGQLRVRWGRTPIDLFFSYDPFHAACQEGIRIVPFGDTTIRILGPEHLVVCKVAFDRRKDWLDIEQIVFATAADIDADEIRHWVGRIIPAGDNRIDRIDAVLSGVGSSPLE